MKIFDQMIGNCQNTKARLNAFYAKFPHLKNYFIFSHHMIAKVTKVFLATYSVVIFIVYVSKGILNATANINIHATLFTIRNRAQVMNVIICNSFVDKIIIFPPL